MGARTGLMCLDIGTTGGLLWAWWWRNFGFHEIRGISLPTEDLLDSEKGLCSMESTGLLSSRTVQNCPLPQHVSTRWQEQIQFVGHCARRRTKSRNPAIRREI